MADVEYESDINFNPAVPEEVSKPNFSALEKEAIKEKAVQNSYSDKEAEKSEFSVVEKEAFKERAIQTKVIQNVRDLFELTALIHSKQTEKTIKQQAEKMLNSLITSDALFLEDGEKSKKLSKYLKNKDFGNPLIISIEHISSDYNQILVTFDKKPSLLVTYTFKSEYKIFGSKIKEIRSIKISEILKR